MKNWCSVCLNSVCELFCQLRVCHAFRWWVMCAKDCPSGKELLVQPCKNFSCQCSMCFYTSRGSFKGKKQTELQEGIRKHHAVKEE